MTEQTERADVLDQALDSVLAEAVCRANASAGMFYLTDPADPADPAEPVLSLVAMAGLPPDVTAPWRRLPLADRLPSTDAVQQDRLVWVGGQEELAQRYPRAAAALPYRMGLGTVPITGADRCWGALLLLFPADHPGRISRVEREELTAGARRMAGLLDAAGGSGLPERARIVPITPVRQRAAQSSPAIGDFAERLPGGSVGLDLQGRITFVTEGAARLLGRSARGLRGKLLWPSVPWLDDPVYAEQYRTAVISRQPVSFTALRPPDHWLGFHLYPDSGGISVRLAPVAPAPGAGAVPPGPTDVPERLIASGSNAPAGRIYQLMHLAAALTEAVGISDVVSLIAGQVLPAFGAQNLLLAEVDAGRLKVTGSQGYSTQMVAHLDGLALDTRLSAIGQVVASGVPAFYANRDEMDPIYRVTMGLSGKQAWAFLPLIVSGRPVGCCVISYDRPHDFTSDERAVLTSLAGLLAQAVDRARLFDAKNQLARDLQQALLPRELPALSGVRAAVRYLPVGRGLEVGGDFYDVIRLMPTSCAAVIGGVRGHNTAAAALTGEIRAAVHAIAGAPPEQVLARVGKVVNDLDLDLLASCLYMHLDLEGRSVTLASAGHPPALLRHGDGRAELLHVEPGPLLGMGQEARYPSRTLPLPEDALLALYTDGLVEIPGTDTDQVTAGLAASLGRSDISDLDHLIDGLIDYGRPLGRNTDDMTILVLHLTAENRGSPP